MTNHEAIEQAVTITVLEALCLRLARLASGFVLVDAKPSGPSDRASAR